MIVRALGEVLILFVMFLLFDKTDKLNQATYFKNNKQKHRQAFILIALLRCLVVVY